MADLERLVMWPVRVLRTRHDMALLAAMDDRCLADIGISRGDVKSAQSLPLDVDPTLELLARAPERRQACTQRGCQH